jgi:hypothetical protein
LRLLALDMDLSSLAPAHHCWRVINLLAYNTALSGAGMMHLSPWHAAPLVLASSA